MAVDFLDAVMAELSKDGWAGLQPVDQKANDEVLKRQRDLMLEEAAVLAAPFETPAGQRALHELMRRTILRPPTLEAQASKSVEEYALLAKQREGQDQVVWMILQAMQIVRGEHVEKVKG